MKRTVRELPDTNQDEIRYTSTSEEETEIRYASKSEEESEEETEIRYEEETEIRYEEESEIRYEEESEEETEIRYEETEIRYEEESEEETEIGYEEDSEIKYTSWDMLEDTWDEHHSKQLRECLQLCSLFPQDYEFQKNDMIQLWIAELLHTARGLYFSEMVDMCSSYFEEFEVLQIFIISSLDHSTHLPRYKLNNSVFHLLQQQHDLVYSRVENTHLYFSDNTLHSSIYDSSFDAITLKNLYNAKRLCTLLIIHESGSRVDQVPREIFLKLPWISVLDLSGTNIKEVPSSIGKLKNLRYLNLSETPIVRLPECVCSLYKMRILKLRRCLKLVSLPNGMRRLIRLQYLDVDVAHLLVSMPPGFGDLTHLHNLPAFVVGRENGCSIIELKEMVNLHGTLRILRLENVSSSKEAADAALDRKKHIVKLQLQWTEFQDGIQFEVLQNLQPHTQIEELQIVGFDGFEFPSWIGNPLFSKLVKITLHDCRKCKLLPPLGKLPFLKHLFVSDMHAVKEIDGLFCGREMVGGLLGFRRLVIKTTAFFKYNDMFLAFPRLESLTLNGMPTLEKWIGIQKGDFHHLQKLSITSCSKLTSLPELSLLMSLQQLEISLCPSLKFLPNKGLPVSLQCLIIMDCPLLKEWCLKEAKLERGKLADIPNIWIDDLHISLNTEVSDSGRNLTARQHEYETWTRENKKMEEQLVNHRKNKQKLKMKKMIFGKKSKGGNGTDGKDFSYASTGKFSSNSDVSPSTPRNEGEILKSSNLKSFSFAELRNATRNFRRDGILGKSQFGLMFKGWIDEQALTASEPGMGIAISVKRLNQEGFQGHSVWLAEVIYLGQFCHPNIVKLVGYCLEDEHRLLVYEFLPRGSLDNHLFRMDSYSQPLSWSLRMKVALGAAKGLAFLHSAENNIIHRDFKTSNILLDSDYNAKLSGFGLARDGPTGDESHISTGIMGTLAYMDPEYALTGRLTAKSDVYGFGVVLLEMLSGRRAIDLIRASYEEHVLVEWAKPYLNHKRKIIRVLDSHLKGQCSLKGARKVAKLALQCLSKEPKLRPNMNVVVNALEGLQESKLRPNMNVVVNALGGLQESKDKEYTTRTESGPPVKRIPAVLKESQHEYNI